MNFIQNVFKKGIRIVRVDHAHSVKTEAKTLELNKENPEAHCIRMWPNGKEKGILVCQWLQAIFRDEKGLKIVHNKNPKTHFTQMASTINEG